MHTKNEERVVWGIFILGIIVILLYYLKSGITIDNILLVLKDSISLILTLFIFIILNSMRNPNYKKAARRAILKTRQRFGDVFYKKTVSSEKENAEKCLFFIKKNQKTSFIPLQPLENGFLEIRISYGTLDRFEYSIHSTDSEKDIKISNVQKVVKEKTINTLQEMRAQYFEEEIREKEKNTAIKVKFTSVDKYERILEKVIENVINLLKEKQGV